MDSPASIPTAEEVRAALKPLTQKQLDRLGELSGVAVPTIAKIKYGQTENPGVDTVGKFWPFIQRARVEIGAAPEPTARAAARTGRRDGPSISRERRHAS